MKSYLLPFLLILSFGSTPPTPEEIFAEEVKYEIFDPYATVHGVVEWDNNTVTLKYASKAYDYPDEIVRIYGVYDTATPGEIELDVVEPEDDLPWESNTWVWFFNSTTGTFSRYEALCGETYPLSRWQLHSFERILYTDQELGQTYLCDPSTGQLSQPLAQGFEWGITELWNGTPPFLDVWTSEDKKWVVFFGKETAILPEIKMHVFSYELATGEIRDLGYFGTDGFTGLYAWYGSQLSFSYDITGISGANQNTLYIADAAQPNSLEVMIEDNIFIYDEPETGETLNRFVVLRNRDPDDLWKMECELIVYDAATRETQVYPMGALCRPEAGDLDGTAYYRDVTQHDDGIATLYKFNSLTGEREPLFTGEIELLMHVSPDERFAILVLDDNEKLDSYPLQAPQGWFASNPRLAYFDLDTKEILIEVPTHWNSYDCDYCGGPIGWNSGLGSYGPTGDIWEKGDGTLIALGDEDICEKNVSSEELYCENRSYLSLFVPDESAYIEQRILDDVEFKIDNDLILFKPSEQSSNQRSIYKISTGETIQLINDWIAENYTMEISLFQQPNQPPKLYVEVDSVFDETSSTHFYVNIADIHALFP